MTIHPADDPAPLLAESAWLHRLARRLVGEPGVAADLAQDTLLAAWQRPPVAGVAWRTWLVGILRHLLRTHHRGQRRRRAREATTFLATTEDPAHTSERLDAHARLLAAVQSLDEPYRTTVTLRFLDELPVDAIAARMQVPAKTVYTRLDRALARLRERLDREYGRRDAWAALLLPLPTLPPTAPVLGLPELAATTPILAMSTISKWALPTAAVAAFGLIAAVALQTDPAPAPPAQVAALPAIAAHGDLAPPPAAMAGAERIAAATTTPPVSSPPPPTTSPVVRGFVRSVDGTPVAGLDVRLEPFVHTREPAPAPAPTPAAARSGIDGSFDVALPNEARRVVADGRGQATLCSASLGKEPPPEPPVVFVGPARRYAGTVVTTDGTPLPRVELEVTLPPATARALTPGSIAATLPIVVATCDAEGHFQLPVLGHCDGLRLTATANGFRGAVLVLPAEDRADLHLVLVPDTGRGRYEGRVEFADGRAAGGAMVAAGDEVATCDAAGRFCLTLRAGPAATQIRAVHRGHLPTVVDLATVPADRHRDLVVVLGAESRTIAGILHDAAGAPIAGARVWTPDGERFAFVPTRIGSIHVNLPCDVENLIAGCEPGAADGRTTRSGADGRFVLHNLLDRDYRLFALVPGSHELVGPATARGGATEVPLMAGGTERRARIAGVVTDFAGTPLAAARLRVQRTRTLPDGSTVDATDRDSVRTTGADGTFAFDGLCLDHTTLVVTDAGGTEVPVDLARANDLGALHVRVPQRCFLRVQIDDPATVDGLRLLDAAGQDLLLEFEVGGVKMRAHAVQVHEGLCERLTVDERARTLVLHKGGREVVRLPLALRPGELVPVRW
jgi:RNA polymerase sigma factor (sigma-70 family)